MRRNTLLIAVIAGLLLALGLAPPASAAPAFRALLFTKTAGYRHDSIPAGISMFQQQAAANNFEVVADRGLERLHRRPTSPPST